VADARIFTLEEAERTLPLLRRILTDLRAEYRVWQDALAEYELLAAGVRAGDTEPSELVTARRSVTDSADRISAFLGEIEAIGCLFYSIRDDRLVFLCWRVEECHITHWHDIDAGYAGRQLIDSFLLTTELPAS
jgi:hypothetical protein